MASDMSLNWRAGGNRSIRDLPELAQKAFENAFPNGHDWSTRWDKFSEHIGLSGSQLITRIEPAHFYTKTLEFRYQPVELTARARRLSGLGKTERMLEERTFFEYSERYEGYSRRLVEAAQETCAAANSILTFVGDARTAVGQHDFIDTRLDQNLKNLEQCAKNLLSRSRDIELAFSDSAFRLELRGKLRRSYQVIFNRWGTAQSRAARFLIWTSIGFLSLLIANDINSGDIYLATLSPQELFLDIIPSSAAFGLIGFFFSAFMARTLGDSTSNCLDRATSTSEDNSDFFNNAHRNLPLWVVLLTISLILTTFYFKWRVQFWGFCGLGLLLLVPVSFWSRSKALRNGKVEQIVGNGLSSFNYSMHREVLRRDYVLALVLGATFVIVSIVQNTQRKPTIVNIHDGTNCTNTSLTIRAMTDRWIFASAQSGKRVASETDDQTEYFALRRTNVRTLGTNGNCGISTTASPAPISPIVVILKGERQDGSVKDGQMISLMRGSLDKLDGRLTQIANAITENKTAAKSLELSLKGESSAIADAIASATRILNDSLIQIEGDISPKDGGNLLSVREYSAKIDLLETQSDYQICILRRMLYRNPVGAIFQRPSAERDRIDSECSP